MSRLGDNALPEYSTEYNLPTLQVDVSGTKTSQAQNEEREFERNRERFLFLKWGAKAFKNMLIVPPGSGIVHQVVIGE